MKFFELIVLLPCHSLEDFPVHHEGNEAEGLLAAWSALWHPSLIASAGALPTWFRADAPPEELNSRLILIPEASESLLLSGWVARAKNEGALVLRKLHRREELVAAALHELDPLDGPDTARDEQQARDFLALGTGYLMVELLTRQMRYMSNIDEVHLKNETVAAAKAWAAGDREETERRLKNCFEVLTEARERFYPVHAYLVDLTLVADTTLGEPLVRELNHDTPTNLLVSGEVIEQLAAREPATLKALRLAIDHKRAAIVGGEYAEGELPLAPRECMLDNFRRGLATYERLLGQRPTVFGRRRFGLSPMLPLVLTRLGFDGALHVTLDDGQFPQCTQSKTRWEGLDPSAIDVLARVPLDAAAPESFLSFPRTMGESMDSDHVATVMFAHWPDRASPFYDDLRRMAAYGSPLGKFTTLDDYFAYTDSPGELTRFKTDQYRAPYLWQAVIRGQADPLSSHIVRAQRAQCSAAARTLGLFADLLSGRPANVAEESCEAAARRLGEAVAGRSDDTASPRGVLVANPASFARQVTIDEAGGAELSQVEVPACGFAWIAPGSGGATTPKPKKPPRPMAEGNLLRNEFFEVTVHPNNGGIRSIHAASGRGNRLSQQLAMRLPAARPQPGDTWRDPDEDAPYSVMCVDAIEVLNPGPVVGELRSRGRLMAPEGKRLAAFTQTLRLALGSRLLQIDVELEIDEPPRADPWNSYYACRFAWPDEAATVLRSIGTTAQPTTAKRIEAPQFVEIQGERSRITLLTGGLPYHRRTSDRMLDTLLVVRGETRRTFRLGVVLDSAHPAQEAVDLECPVVRLNNVRLPSAASGAGWLFHIDARSVLLTACHGATELDRSMAVRLRLLETEGKAGRVKVRCWRTPGGARQVDFLGQTMTELPIAGDAVAIDIAAYEWIEIEVQL